jgi:hypothetical protein
MHSGIGRRIFHLHTHTQTTIAQATTMLASSLPMNRAPQATAHTIADLIEAVCADPRLTINPAWIVVDRFGNVDTTFSALDSVTGTYFRMHIPIGTRTNSEAALAAAQRFIRHAERNIYVPATSLPF